MQNETVTKNQQVTAISAAILSQDAGVGLENVTPEDLIIPQLKIAQKTNKEVDENDGAFIPGVQIGDVMNNITSEFYGGDEGITVIPVAYKRVYLEFIDRDAGGGFVALHENPAIINETTRNNKGQDELQNGNYIQTTANHYVLLLEDGKATPVMVAMSSTQLKKSRRWNSMMAGLRLRRKDGTSFTPSSFSHSYQLTTVPEKNSKGTWYGWKIDMIGQLKDVSLYNAAKAFGQTLSSAELNENTEDVPF
jgi:hypothetical protein